MVVKMTLKRVGFALQYKVNKIRLQPISVTHRETFTSFFRRCYWIIDHREDKIGRRKPP